MDYYMNKFIVEWVIRRGLIEEEVHWGFDLVTMINWLPDN
jgi:hypothetical protein